jgi:hypothetical protein
MRLSTILYLILSGHHFLLYHEAKRAKPPAEQPPRQPPPRHPQDRLALQAACLVPPHHPSEGNRIMSLGGSVVGGRGLGNGEDGDGDGDGDGKRQRRRHCVLFYKYHSRTDDRSVLESYRSATEDLCSSLDLVGRVLLGWSNDGEGINDTLAGSRGNLEAYVDCMLGGDGGGGGC